jgi:hypothetical protein
MTRCAPRTQTKIVGLWNLQQGDARITNVALLNTPPKEVICVFGSESEP